MTQRTRYFLFGSALVLTFGLGTGLVAFYNGNLPSRSMTSALDELAYLPQSSVAVAYADVRSIMGSEFRQKLRQVLPTGEAKDEFLKETGIDIEQDIDTVVAGFAPGGASPEQGAVVLIRGRFNVQQMETLATQHGAVVEQYGGKRLILFNHGQAMALGQAHDGLTMAVPQAPIIGANGGVALLEPGLLAIGATAAIKGAIDAAAKHEDVTKNAEMMKFINEASAGGNAWVVGQFDAMTKNANLPSEVIDRMPAVQWFAVNVNVNGRLSGLIRAETRDDQSAEQLRDVVRGGLAAARLMSGNDPKADALVNSLQVMGTGKNVSLSFTLPVEILDMINGVAGLGKMGHGDQMGHGESRPPLRIER